MCIFCSKEVITNGMYVYICEKITNVIIPDNIKTLRLVDIGFRITSINVNSYNSKLSELLLCDFINLRTLPKINSLTNLTIISCHIKTISYFPNLTYLKLTSCKYLNKISQLPNLTDLWIYECTNLKNLTYLPFLKNIEIYDSSVKYCILSASIKNIDIISTHIKKIILSKKHTIKTIQLLNLNHLKYISPIYLEYDSVIDIHDCNKLLKLQINSEDDIVGNIDECLSLLIYNKEICDNVLPPLLYSPYKADNDRSYFINKFNIIHTKFIQKKLSQYILKSLLYIIINYLK